MPAEQAVEQKVEVSLNSDVMTLMRYNAPITKILRSVIQYPIRLLALEKCVRF